MFAKFITGLLAFLLMLFPNSLGLQSSYQSRTFDRDATAHAVLNAIEARDVDALAAMMCKNIKQYVPGLSGKIKKLYDAIDAIDDKANISWKWLGVYSETQRDGKHIVQSDLNVYFETADDVYLLMITWETINNFSPDERGIRLIDFYNIRLFEEGQQNPIAGIRATDGIGHWHE
ncbi:MAG: DUF5104 domain-containing protein [Firmicutes bacterium]|nr:DUF5104 domain-containing protein [Bacillota bacterium]